MKCAAGLGSNNDARAPNVGPSISIATVLVASPRARPREVLNLLNLIQLQNIVGEVSQMNNLTPGFKVSPLCPCARKAF